MQGRVFIPLIDLAFLSLGAIVAILSQTQLIRSLPVEVAVGKPPTESRLSLSKTTCRRFFG